MENQDKICKICGKEDSTELIDGICSSCRSSLNVNPSQNEANTSQNIESDENINYFDRANVNNSGENFLTPEELKERERREQERSDYEEFLEYEKQQKNNKEIIDKLVWHKIYVWFNIGVSATALIGLGCSILYSAFMEGFTGAIATLITSIISAAWNGFVIYSAINLWQNKQIGIKQTYVKCGLEIASHVIVFIFGLILAIVGFTSGDFGIIAGIFGVFMLVFSIPFICLSIFNICYYKKRSYLFTEY